MLAAMRQRRMGRMRAATMRSIRVTAATHEELSRLAAAQGQSLAVMVARLVASGKHTRST